MSRENTKFVRFRQEFVEFLTATAANRLTYMPASVRGECGPAKAEEAGGSTPSLMF